MTGPAESTHLPAAGKRWPGGAVGSATLNLVVVFPVFLLLLTSTVQAALVWHARNVARAAAGEGLAVTRSYLGTPELGRQRTEQFLTEVGGDLINSSTITVTRTATTARVTVHGQALSLIPGVHVGIDSSLVAAVERFTPDLPAPAGNAGQSP